MVATVYERRKQANAREVTAELGLVINGQGYSLRGLDPEPQVARVAWQLVKLADPTCIYHVGVLAGRAHCTCPDFTFRRGLRGLPCKHVAALRQCRLIGPTWIPA